MTSQPLYLCCNKCCIDRSQQFWKLSHLAHIWHHTHSTWHHNHTLWHHSSVFMTSQPLHSWHQIPYIGHHPQGLWHLVPYPCDITDTIFENTYQLYLTSNTRCRDNTTTISEITTSICVSVWSHTLYWWYNSHCIYHMAPTIFISHLMVTYDISSTLYDITPQYDLHTHCIHVITPRIHVVASTAAELLLTVYWVYHICNMCDLKTTICMASHEFCVTSQQVVKTS